jgi:DNA-binding CsgD family transcriptional regulator
MLKFLSQEKMKTKKHIKDYEEIARAAGLSEEEIKEAVKRIKGKTYSHITSNKIA